MYMVHWYLRITDVTFDIHIMHYGRANKVPEPASVHMYVLPCTIYVTSKWYPNNNSTYDNYQLLLLAGSTLTAA